ncbi:beta-ketoacyl-ACP synthase III [Alkalibaculum sp. M08DMB]|uniref:Beta-ketoacyl-[acyl-carrier-protein] synthase III n=1 Tax=Alkalibaculum sporogenes TaxID=2655001 RepID=A0A6A7KAB6_9FIRM|nr:beta-ketoacyl-ACP synthase III [Alkalibaculum sporogenes]MPW26384.1 beta-ketoacyl-ACP synthase III [Alkalibaculum sporogenes]
MNKSKIIATGKYSPELAVSNFDLEKVIDTNDEWIYSRTGIKERRISQNESTLDLTYKASLDAIKKNNIDLSTIDLIIVATTTPDYFIPSTASLLQSRLGLNDSHVTCFDISAACTGLIYGIQIADKFIASGSVRKALVVGAEIFSKVLDWEDRGTCVLFGDGAGAVILEQSDKGILADYTNSSGDDNLSLTLPAVSLGSPFSLKELDCHSNNYLKMNGSEIFKFAAYAIKDSIDHILVKSNLTIEDIKYIVPHQANQRIIAKVSKDMKIPLEKFYMNLEYYGNTSAASIGMALDDLYGEDNLIEGDKILLIGFGGGLTWGSILFEY